MPAQRDVYHRALLEASKTIDYLSKRIRSIETQVGGSYFAHWTDYSTTSTIVGWSVFTTKVIFYTRLGSRIFVQYRLVGTSDSVDTSFTVPYTQQAGIRLRVPVLAQDNSGSYAWGMAELPISSDVVTFYPTLALGAWTAGNTKEIAGEFWYEMA